MQRYFIYLCLLLFTVLFYLQPCLADKDGGELFFSRCGSCHRKGGDAPELVPVKFAGVQWERFFDRNKHIRKKDIGDIFSEGEIASIRKFLVDHAADSDRPIVAGVR